MNSTGGGQIVKIGMTTGCEIQMNWEKSNKVAKEHLKLYIDHERQLPILKPLEKGVIYNARIELPIGRATILSNHDTFKVGDTIFQYIEE
jgi:acetone carboxylase gamma subunit